MDFLLLIGCCIVIDTIPGLPTVQCSVCVVAPGEQQQGQCGIHNCKQLSLTICILIEPRSHPTIQAGMHYCANWIPQKIITAVASVLQTISGLKFLVVIRFCIY